MAGTIKNFIYAGVGVVLAYLLISQMMTSVTATDSSTVLFKSIVPLMYVIGGVLIILGVVFI